MAPLDNLQIHYLQHVSFEGLGSIEPYMRQKGHRLCATRLYKGDRLPPLEGVDWLIVMGGPMGVSDDVQYPWLRAEKAFIRNAVGAGKTVLGICLGAQLIADALGAGVKKNKHREIGWFPVESTEEASQTELGRVFPRTLEAFHWHGDTFENPPNSTRLATSQACSNQGFVIEERVVGLQFHLETTPEAAGLLIDNCGHELDRSRFVQTKEEIMSDQYRFGRINAVMQSVLAVLERQSR